MLDRALLKWETPAEDEKLPSLYSPDAAYVFVGRYEGQTVAAVYRKRVQKPFVHDIFGSTHVIEISFGGGVSSRQILEPRVRVAAVVCEITEDFLFGALTRRIVCVECGALSDVDNKTATAKLRAASLCHGCDFWRERVAEFPSKPENFVAEGKHYSIGDEPEGYAAGSCLGFGGQPWVVRWPDGREVKTTNLWSQGAVPPHFRERLPDTAQLQAIHPDGHPINVVG